MVGSTAIGKPTWRNSWPPYLDLEGILEDYDRSITMLRRMRNVLDQLGNFGAPPEEIEALRMNCMRPEALPSVAIETRRLIRVALDDIYLEADQRDAGEAIALEQTAQVLGRTVDTNRCFWTNKGRSTWSDVGFPDETDSCPLNEPPYPSDNVHQCC